MTVHQKPMLLDRGDGNSIIPQVCGDVKWSSWSVVTGLDHTVLMMSHPAWAL